MRRVAYVCADPGIPVLGTKGAAVHVREVIRAFRRRGTDVSLLSPRTGGRPPGDLQDVDLHPLPAVGRGAAAEREVCERSSADVVPDLLAGMDEVALVYERYSLWSAAGLEYAAGRGIPTVLEVNAPLIDEQVRYRGLIDRRAAEASARRAFAVADVVVAVSEPVAAWVSARMAADRRVHVVPNGVDPARFAPVPRPDPRCFTAGFVGTLKPWHGVDVLVRALAVLAAEDPTWRLLVVGDGPERQRLEQTAVDLGVGDAVTFTGAVTERDVPRLLTRMDAGVAPYPDSGYFSPLKVLEYFAAGLPVVASNVREVTDLVRDRETGMLCVPGDPTSLAAALRRLRRDPERAGLGRRGRALVEHTRTWDHVLDRILGLVARTSPGARVCRTVA